MNCTRPTATWELFQPSRDGKFFADVSPAAVLQRPDLLCAELSRLAYAAPDMAEQALDAIGFHRKEMLGAGADSRRLSAGTQALVAWHDLEHAAVVAFRGTESGVLDDLVTDAHTLQTNGPGGSRIHAGFAAAYDSVREALRSKLERSADRLFLTGHSLGGALANLAAVDHPGATLVTFGAPRVGDSRFVEMLADVKKRRYVNCCDVVPRLPPESFDAESLAELLTEFWSVAANLHQVESAVASSAVFTGRMTAMLAAGAARIARIDVEFQHAGPPVYVSRTGSVWLGAEESEMRRDREAARADYRRVVHEVLPGLDVARVFQRIVDIASTAARGGGMELVRKLLRDLRDSATLEYVLVRDFADHAPARYVEALNRLGK